MTNVLVLVEHTQGELKNSTLELITAARAFGTVGAVVVGAPGTAEKLLSDLAAAGAENIYAAESDAAADLVVTPSVDAVSGLAAQVQVPVIVAAGAAGNEIAGRVGARVASGVLYDVIGINEDRSAQGSIFGGDFTVTAAAGGTARCTLRAGAVDPEPQAAAGNVFPVELPAAGPTAVTVTSFSRRRRLTVRSSPRRDRRLRWPWCRYRRLHQRRRAAGGVLGAAVGASAPPSTPTSTRPIPGRPDQ